MRRFFYPDEVRIGQTVALPAEILHHLRVLRMTPGEHLELLDGRGGIAGARIIELQRDSATVAIDTWRREDDDGLELHLLQGIPKGSKMDLVLQKGTELGVTRFTPVFCRHGDVQLPRERLASRTERWARIAQEAARQCRRERLPRVDPPQPLSEALADCPASLRLMPWEQEARPLGSVLAIPPPASVAVLIGPEGGFAPAEAALARAAGFIPVSLGRRILRSETAGLAVTAVLQYLFGDLGSGRASAPAAGSVSTTPE